MCSLDPDSCSVVTQAVSLRHTNMHVPAVYIESMDVKHLHAYKLSHDHTHRTPSPHTTQQPPPTPTQLMFFPYYVKVDTHNCAGVVGCFCWPSSTAPVMSLTEAIDVQAP